MEFEELKKESVEKLKKEYKKKKWGLKEKKYISNLIADRKTRNKKLAEAIVVSPLCRLAGKCMYHLRGKSKDYIESNPGELAITMLDIIKAVNKSSIPVKNAFRRYTEGKELDNEQLQILSDIKRGFSFDY